jgi:hypothetical protein
MFDGCALGRPRTNPGWPGLGMTRLPQAAWACAEGMGVPSGAWDGRPNRERRRVGGTN